MTPLNKTPKQLGYRWPAEWEPHRAMWLVWPHNVATWPDRFTQAREQFAHFVETVARYELVELLAVGAARENAAERLANVRRRNIHAVPTNDSWIRDYGPIFLNNPPGCPPLLLDWQYNAWGNKYPPYDLDNRVPQQIASLTARRCLHRRAVLEGGSVDGNGAGIVLTTDRCLPNANRNPSLSQPAIEATLCDYLCADHVIWLTGEILGDDTDGHVDQIARFVDTTTVMLVDQPGSDMYVQNRARLRTWSSESGIQLEVIPIQSPQPRRVNGMWLPASYANFVIVNGAVLVPEFNDPADSIALKRFAECFSDRTIEMIPADSLVFGLGALHCLSQQEPQPTGRE